MGDICGGVWEEDREKVEVSALVGGCLEHRAGKPHVGENPD